LTQAVLAFTGAWAPVTASGQRPDSLMTLFWRVPMVVNMKVEVLSSQRETYFCCMLSKPMICSPSNGWPNISPLKRISRKRPSRAISPWKAPRGHPALDLAIPGAGVLLEELVVLGHRPHLHVGFHGFLLLGFGLRFLGQNWQDNQHYRKKHDHFFHFSSRCFFLLIRI
jgi:hypothetical protein